MKILAEVAQLSKGHIKDPQIQTLKFLIPPQGKGKNALPWAFSV